MGAAVGLPGSHGRMKARVVHAEIPPAMRDLLDELFDEAGVEMWWNSRHTTFDNRSPADEWHHSSDRRDRVCRWVEYITGGAW